MIRLKRRLQISLTSFMALLMMDKISKREAPRQLKLKQRRQTSKRILCGSLKPKEEILALMESKIRGRARNK